jgi:hypothetical protein
LICANCPWPVKIGCLQWGLNIGQGIHLKRPLIVVACNWDQVLEPLEAVAASYGPPGAALTSLAQDLD